MQTRSRELWVIDMMESLPNTCYLSFGDSTICQKIWQCMNDRVYFRSAFLNVVTCHESFICHWSVLCLWNFLVYCGIINVNDSYNNKITIKSTKMQFSIRNFGSPTSHIRLSSAIFIDSPFRTYTSCEITRFIWNCRWTEFGIFRDANFETDA